MSATVRIRTDGGELLLDLEELEQRIARGELAPDAELLFPTDRGMRWVRADTLELWRLRFSPTQHAFRRRFHLGRVPPLTTAFVLLLLGLHLALAGDQALEADALVRWGGKVAPLILDLGESWRLLTANLIHRDLLHVAFNAFVLFNLGGALENAYRPIDYLLLLLASALGCTTVSLVFAPEAISVGASGMAYGCMGGAFVFGVRFREVLPARYRSVLGEAVLPALLGFLLLGLSSPGIDNWGHLGGLVAGALVAGWAPPRLLLASRTPRASTLTRGAVLLGVPLAVIATGSALAPALPLLVPVRDELAGVALRVPASWRQSSSPRRSQLTVHNGLPGLGRARLTTEPLRRAAGESFNEGLARGVEAPLLEAMKAGTLENLALGQVQPTRLAGRDALALEAHYDDAETGAVHLRAVVVPRGVGGQLFVAALPEAWPGYESAIDAMLSTVELIEPRDVEQARGRALLLGSSASAWATLGDALLECGEPAQAAEALSRALRLEPRDHGLRGRWAQALLEAGDVEAGCRLAHAQAGTEREEQGWPGALDVWLARVDCERARGGDGSGWLARARQRAPMDAEVQRRFLAPR